MNHLISRVPDKPCAYPISAAGAGAEREFTLGNTVRLTNIPTRKRDVWKRLAPTAVLGVSANTSLCHPTGRPD